MSRVGTKLGHYEILAPLGKGGMGEVFVARDSRLGRRVALKTLPAEVAGDPDRLARFQREARALAALNHPNIVTVHSIEDLEQEPFLTMELVEGTTLSERIPSGGLDDDRLIPLALALTDGLAAAHARGIAHRDLKPANVMIAQDGRLKILDFGLAHGLDTDPTASESSDTILVTREGVVLGTAPYLSPEQVRGRRADLRSDVFALGVVLHEMSAGSRPFDGDSVAELFSAILRDPAPPLAGPLAAVVTRCLQKRPEDRFPDARAVHAAILALSSGTGGTPGGAASSVASAETAGSRLPTPGTTEPTPWIAVLPFRTRTADPTLRDFGEELAEELTAGLARFPIYRVVPSRSTRGWADRRGGLGEIATELGARYVLEGSLRETSGRIRVRAHLADAVAGNELWSETYDRESAGDVFALLDDLTDRIVATVADVHGILARSMGALVRSQPVAELGVYESVLQWFAYFEHVSPTEHARTREALERAVEIAPDDSCAHACLAQVLLDEHRFRFNTREDPLGRALETARRAVRLDATSGLAACALAMAHLALGDHVAFRTTARRAMDLNPRDAHTHALLGAHMSMLGDFETGIPITERAMELNPHHPGWYWFGHFDRAYVRGAYEEALEIAKRVAMPGHFFFHASVAAAAGQLGREEDARPAVRDLLALSPEFPRRARESYRRLQIPESLSDHLIEGLRKAGLEIADDPADGREGLDPT